MSQPPDIDVSMTHCPDHPGSTACHDCSMAALDEGFNLGVVAGHEAVHGFLFDRMSQFFAREDDGAAGGVREMLKPIRAALECRKSVRACSSHPYPACFGCRRFSLGTGYLSGFDGARDVCADTVLGEAVKLFAAGRDLKAQYYRDLSKMIRRIKRPA